MAGALIGGEELEKLIYVIDLHGRIDPARICLEVDRDHLRAGGVPIKDDDRVIEQAIGIVRADLAAKMKHRDGFVSIRLHIGNEVLRMRSTKSPLTVGNFESVNDFFEAEAASDDGVLLKAGEFAVFRTLERVSLPSDVAAFVQTRTTVAFVGLDVTPTCQIVPGFHDGILFLEVHNRAPIEVVIPRHAPLAELFFFRAGGSFSGDAPDYWKLRNELQEEEGDGTLLRVIAEPIEVLYEPLLTAAAIAAGLFMWRVLEHRVLHDFLYLSFVAVVVVLIGMHRYLMSLRERLLRFVRKRFTKRA